MPTATLVISHNFLAGPYIDRRSESREEADWRAAAGPPTRSCASRAVGTAVIVGGAMPAETHPSRRWDSRPHRRYPRGGGASAGRAREGIDFEDLLQEGDARRRR